MKRLIAFVILLIHVNTSMFIPVADEVDVFDESGMQVGDINTLTDYVKQAIFGQQHKSKHDNDDDQAHYFNIMMKVKTCIVSQFQVVRVLDNILPVHKAISYPDLREEKLPSVAYDVPAPPPWHLS